MEKLQQTTSDTIYREIAESVRNVQCSCGNRGTSIRISYCSICRGTGGALIPQMPLIMQAVKSTLEKLS